MRYLITFLCLLMPGAVLAIEVSGDVSGVWVPENNPYEVVGDLRVPRESTLSIMPGCYIEFQGHYKFVVDSLATFSAGRHRGGLHRLHQRRYFGRLARHKVDVGWRRQRAGLLPLAVGSGGGGKSQRHSD